MDGVVLLFSLDPRSQLRMRVTMLRLGKLWVGGLLGCLIVHVVIIFFFCLGLAARLIVKFVSHSNATGTMRE